MDGSKFPSCIHCGKINHGSDRLQERQDGQPFYAQMNYRVLQEAGRSSKLTHSTLLVFSRHQSTTSLHLIRFSVAKEQHYEKHSPCELRTLVASRSCSSVSRLIRVSDYHEKHSRKNLRNESCPKQNVDESLVKLKSTVRLIGADLSVISK